MLRQIKPKNARSKRALATREPKLVENTKTCLFLRGTTCSQTVQDVQDDLFALRAPHNKKFSKRNDVRPFEDASSLEFFSEKNDCGLMVFGSRSKKRGDALCLARFHGHALLDMLEVAVDPATYVSLARFQRGDVDGKAGQDAAADEGATAEASNGTTEKKAPRKLPAVGMRPMLNFSGTLWDSPVDNEYTLAKSFLTDYFRGDSTPDAVDVEGLQYVVSFTVGEESAEAAIDAGAAAGAAASGPKPPIHMRVYTIRTRRSGGSRLPRVDVDEIGPRIDLRVGRMRAPDETLWKEAMRKPTRESGTAEERTKKNISTDAMGDKMGRVHIGKQDLGKLQTRKLKGLKRSRDMGSDDGGDDEGGDLVTEETSKRTRKA